MTCGGCSGAVEKILGKLGGEYLRFYVNQFQVDCCKMSQWNKTKKHRANVLSSLFADKVQNVQIDLDAKKVFVTSSELTADELLEKIQKSGKQTTYVGVKSA